MDRNRPPALFVAMDGLDGDTKKLRHLFLCFLQFFAQCAELFVRHYHIPFSGKRSQTPYFCHIVVCVSIIFNACEQYSFCRLSSQRFRPIITSAQPEMGKDIRTGNYADALSSARGTEQQHLAHIVSGGYVMQSSKGTILVVDDDASTRRLMKDTLETEGFLVIEAENGVDALDRVFSDNRPDLITINMELPEKDGITLCRNIREVIHHEELPVIFLTSVTDQERLSAAFKAGATDYLARPFLTEELLARLRVHLERARLARKLSRTTLELNRVKNQHTENQRLQGVVEMAGAVCHELNQPIQTVSGFAELMMMKADEKDPLIPYARKIKKQVDRMGEITGKLMRVTAYRTKDHDSVTRIIDINEAAGEHHEVL